MKNIFYVLIMGMFPIIGLAGNDGGGGFVIQCKGKPLVIQDYFEASLPNIKGVSPKLFPLDDESLKNTREIVIKRLETRTKALSERLFYSSVLFAHYDFSKSENWVSAQLDQYPDDSKTPYKDCKRLRIAFRQGSTVFVEASLVPQLSNGQIFVLELHEWLYAASRKNTSDSVRQVVRELLKSNEEFSEPRLVRLLGIMLTKWEMGEVRLKYGDLDTYSEENANSICRKYDWEYVVALFGVEVPKKLPPGVIYATPSAKKVMTRVVCSRVSDGFSGDIVQD